MFAGPIVIVNYNSGPYLRRCLGSIAECAPAAHVVVVDNASADGSACVSDHPHLRVTLVANDRNIGFAAAVNRGLRHAAGDRVLILNPDCRLMAGAAERLVQELSEHPECAIAAPQALNDDGAVQGNARGDPTLMTGLFGRASLLTRLFPRSGPARRNVRTELATASDASLEVDWVSGACMMARRDTLDEVGGFDERYFLYWEDADLCRRLRDRGFTTRYVPQARVVHSVGGSSQSARALAVRAFHHSAYTYYASHVARGPLPQALAWLLLQARCRWKLRAARCNE